MLSQEDQATDTSNMCTKFREIWTRDFRDMRASRHTHTQTDKHTDRQTGRHADCNTSLTYREGVINLFNGITINLRKIVLMLDGGILYVAHLFHTFH